MLHSMRLLCRQAEACAGASRSVVRGAVLPPGKCGRRRSSGSPSTFCRKLCGADHRRGHGGAAGRRLLAALDETLAPANVILRADTPARSLEGLEVYVRAAKATPGALRWKRTACAISPILPQAEDGWYYDQRDNRAFVAHLARGRSVLDAYCYSGGFALAAAHAGAKEVAGLDSSAPALALRRTPRRPIILSCAFRASRCVRELERLWAARESFDMVVADPPPFVKAKKDLRSVRSLSQAGAAGGQCRGERWLHSAGKLLAQHLHRAFRAECSAASRAPAAPPG